MHFGISMQARRPLRNAEATLPQMREDFTLMQPYLNTLMQAFPSRTPNIVAPTIRDGVSYPLRLRYRVQVPGTLTVNSYNYDYEEWYALDWFSQDAIDAIVFLTSSPYLSHTLSEIWIEPLGTSSLMAYVNPWNYTTNVLIFRGSPNQRFAETRVHHREELGNGYFLHIHTSSFYQTLGRFVIGFGVVIIIFGSVPTGFAIFRRKKSEQSPI